MFKKMTVVALLLGAVLLLAACTGSVGTRGRGDMVSRDIDVAGFSALDAGGVFVVSFRQSDTYAVRAEMQENLFDLLELNVRGNTLHAGFSRSINVSAGNTPRLYIYAPEINELTVRGAMSTGAWDTITAPHFTLTISGAGSVNFALDVDTLDVNISGAGSATLRGHADSASLTMSGAGSIAGFGLQTREAHVRLTGAGSVDIGVSDLLEVHLAGVGNVRYDGNPEVRRSGGGLGSVRQR